MSIKFVDELPPRKGPGGRKWVEVADQLREHPGRWAEVHRDATYSKTQSPVTALRRFHDIEATRRRVGNEVIVFARAVTQ